MNKVGANIKNTLFLDDMQKYTDGWAAMGGTAVLIGTQNGKPLSADARPMICARMENPDNLQGKTIRLNSIYELPQLLKKMEDEQDV